MTTTDDRLLALERAIASLADRVSNIENATRTPRSMPPAKPSSLNEVLKQKSPTSDVQRLLVVGHFLQHQGMESFNLNDLTAAFARAKIAAPTNPNDAVNKNIRKGFIEEVPGKKDGLKAWHLTRSGEGEVEAMKGSGGK